jgi:pullulanase-type alpha-1,6-glucosidase
MPNRLRIIAAVALAACGDGGGTTPTPDARLADAAATADAAPPSPNFTVHYHRADGDYAGWTLAPTAGAAGAVSTGTADGFGAVYTVMLAPGAQSFAFSLMNASSTDPAGALTVDVSGATREAWVISGWPEAITRPLPALPGEDQIAVYYLRADDAYSGWGLHLWGDQVTNTTWQAPLQPSGIDPDFGAGFLIDVTPGAPAGNCPPGNICLIVHKGDTKDPGPDMTFDPDQLGNLVFLLTGSSEITPMPRRVGDVGISGVGAHLFDDATLAWCLGRGATGDCVNDATLVSAELRHSPTAAIKAEGIEITGGTVIALTRRQGGLTAEQLALAPYMHDFAVFDIAPADRPALAEAVKGQMVAVARKADGSAGRATQVNTALYLDEEFAHDGALGVTFAAKVPTFHLWAPTAQSVRLHVFDAARAEIAGSPFTMTRRPTGTWEHTGVAGWYGGWYRYGLTVYHPLTGKVEEFTTTDPYAVNLAPNGTHAQIVDLDDPALVPPGWGDLEKPALDAFEDVVLYELHIRDFSVSDATVPAERRGKYLAFASDTASAGRAHLEALASAGLTHVHLLPAFDIATVDEDPANRVDLDDPFARLCEKNPMVPAALCAMFPAQTIREALESFPGDSEQQQRIVDHLRPHDSFNWGYDPFHYGAPEGSYASTADGTARIVEFRRMVQGLAAVGLRVVMDVVYNHTNAAGVSDKSVLDKIVPGYYHRLDEDTGFVFTSSCCANTASEHRMMERLIVDMSVRWAREYKVDGFRFDLMGLHMKSNMLAVVEALRALTPGRDGVDGEKIHVYGEGWDIGELQRNAGGVNATQRNMAGTGVGTFNDRIRDGIRGGGPFDSGAVIRETQGFATGLFTDPNDLGPTGDAARTRLAQLADLIKTGMAGGLADFRMVAAHDVALPAGAIGYGGAPAGYTQDPQETINYTSAHDNQVLWDIVQYKLPAGTPVEERVRAHDLAQDLVLLGQGIPFIHAGDELLRSKSMDRNSYDSGDWFNFIDWSGMATAWRAGLPPQGENGAAWPVVREIFADPSTAPRPGDPAFAAAHVKEMLRVRKSSVLFRLRTKADVMKRVDFLNAGSQQVPGLIVMTVADGACAGEDLDPARDGVVVIVNADDQEHAFTVPGAAGAVLHPVLAASVDPRVTESSVAGEQLTVPARTSAVFDIPQTAGRAGPPCNAR